ncbi:GntR family transcriptional regulator [Streptomyces sp. NBC_01324]|uniref:GntR family transcriptional regulator n=1 Tax=Streptomyces sp. NBC_01324 TaxID=2903826 RepID=UPI002E0E7D78|nr:GntR family transcriptional regulator [Streptomyces sp. NBC_01324]
MAEHVDKRPLAERIAADLRARIMAGDLPSGQQLGSNAELRDEFDTSNVTIQRALAILKNERLIEGKNGVGVYVRERLPQIITPASYTAPAGSGQPYSWITQAQDRGQRGSNKVISVAEVAPPPRVTAGLASGDTEPAVLRVRLGLLDGEPAELVHSYYPAELARGTRLADRRKIPGGSPTLLADMGYPPREQVDEVATRMATTEEYELLEIPGDTPVLEIFRVVYSDDRRPIEVTVLVKPGHLYKMGYHLSI